METETLQKTMDIEKKSEAEIENEAAPQEEELPTLPALRPDLSIYTSPPSAFGIPKWSLYDPVRNAFFKIGWVEFEILQRWGMADCHQILEDIAEKTTMHVSLTEIKALIKFLTDNQLIQANSKEQVQQLKDMHDSQQKMSYAKYFTKYFYLRIKILFPDQFLNQTMKYVKPLFSKTFFALFMVFSLISLYLIGREWYHFESTVAHFFSFNNVVYYFAVIIVAKIFHEFGHAYAAKYYGCRVPTIGVVFIFFWPIFFTDTTDLWKLKSRKPRLVVGVAGVITELLLATIATFIWLVLPESPFRNAMFFIASFSWVLSIMVNINPFLKFDGYYVLSDLLRVDNLQHRSFALAKWKTRQTLIGMDVEPPEQFPRAKRNILITYAYATWLFRIFLYSSIAYSVYTFFFKLAGIILIASVIWIMVITPVSKEIKAMWDFREHFHFNKTNTIFLGTVVALFCILFIPWHSYTRIPAVLDFAQQYKIYTPDEARIRSLQMAENQLVTKGQPLIQMDLPEVTYEKAKALKQIDIIKYRINRETGNTEQYKFNQAGIVDLEQKQQELKALEEKEAMFSVTAPFDGIIKHVSEGIADGSWLPKGVLVAEVISTDKRIIRAYISEQDLSLIKPDMEARFFAENIQIGVLDAKLIEIDKLSTTKLEDLALATQFGGDILTETLKSEETSVRPIKGIFRLTFQVDNQIDYPLIIRGKIVLKTKPTSLMRSLINKIQTVLIRESGF